MMRSLSPECKFAQTRSWSGQSSNGISGGGCTKDGDGNLVLIKDQDGDTGMVSSIINSMEFNVPVGLIIG